MHTEQHSGCQTKVPSVVNCKTTQQCSRSVTNATRLINVFFALSVQLLSEKISGAEGTKLDEDFMEMDRVSSDDN